MCDTIYIRSTEKDIGSIRQFQDHYKVDATEYGWDGNEYFIDCCMCDLELSKFFKEHPEHKAFYDCGEWISET